jgi:hypothetical protein
MRESEFESGPAVANHYIHAVQGRGMQTDKGFSWFGFGGWKFSVFKDFRSTMLVEEDGFHVTSLVVIGRDTILTYFFRAMAVNEPLSE